MPTKHVMIDEIVQRLPHDGNRAIISKKTLAQLFGDRRDRRLYRLYREAAAGHVLNAVNCLLPLIPERAPYLKGRQRLWALREQLRQECHAPRPLPTPELAPPTWCCPECQCPLDAQPTHCPSCDARCD